MSEGLERAVGVGRGGEDQTAFAVATQTFLMLALLKLYSIGAQTPSPASNMAKPEGSLGDRGAGGPLLFRLPRRSFLPSLVEILWSTDIYYQGVRQPLTHTRAAFQLPR